MSDENKTQEQESQKSSSTIVRQEFVNMDDFEKMIKVADYFCEAQALPKWVDNAWKLVMVLQGGRDLGLSVTQSMSGLAMINGIITVYWSVAAVMMKRAWRDRDISPTEDVTEKKKVKIKKWDKEVEEEKTILTDKIKTLTIWNKSEPERKREIVYKLSEAEKAWLTTKDIRQNYTDDMMYRKCLARARKYVCPEVLDWYAIYEDYQDIESNGKKSKSNAPALTASWDNLSDQIANAESIEQLDLLIDDIRKSKSKTLVAEYAKKKKELENLTDETDADTIEIQDTDWESLPTDEQAKDDNTKEETQAPSKSE